MQQHLNCKEIWYVINYFAVRTTVQCELNTFKSSAHLHLKSVPMQLKITLWYSLYFYNLFKKGMVFSLVAHFMVMMSWKSFSVQNLRKYQIYQFTFTGFHTRIPLSSYHCCSNSSGFDVIQMSQYKYEKDNVIKE